MKLRNRGFKSNKNQIKFIKDKWTIRSLTLQYNSNQRRIQNLPKGGGDHVERAEREPNGVREAP